jgi:hypothetical protein
VHKRLFSITCTTCQARLAVRSEAAIGTILECPRCESMVQVQPPPGWKPAASPTTTPSASVPAGPPPLDCVAAGPLTLELELPNASFLARLLGPNWLLLRVAPLATLIVVLALLWLAFPRPAPDLVAPETQPLATATEHFAPVAERPAAERPATAIAGALAGQPPAAPPGTQSGGVKDKPTSKKPPPTESTTPTATVAEPTSPPATRPSQTAGAKRPQPVLSPSVARETAARPADDPHRAEVKKAPPARVDVAARLNDPVAQLELTDMPLAKAIDLLAAMGVLPITIDADAMTQLGVAPRDPISLRLSSTTLGKALEAAAAQKGLAVAVENGQVLITAPAEYRESLREVRYTVADLTGEDKAAAAELAKLVQKLVAPESWHAAGGRGTIAADSRALAVVQTGNVHHQVLVFCEKLRNARHKPLRSRDDPQRFTLTTQSARARKMLEQPVTANFHEPTPLVKVLAFLAEAAECDILIDRAALAAAETSDRVEAAWTAKKQPLGAVLTELLRPLGLTYRTLGAQAVQVTTPEAVEERLELEFHPIGPWLVKQDSPLLPGEGQQHSSALPLGEGPGVRAAKLIQRLKTKVAAATWSDAGGSAEVCFDPPSQCLIVLQSQPAQAAIERLLKSP